MLATNNECSQCIYKENCIENPDDCHSYINKYSVAYGVVPCEESSLCDYNNTIKIGVGLENKSRLQIGNLVIHNTHHFNWLHRKMWKMLLGFDIENVDGGQHD